MKKTLLAAIICAVTAISPLFGQAHTQSLSFSDPGPLNGATGQAFTVSVLLDFEGYGSFGLSYWLEVQNALAPFLTITGATYFTFPDPNQLSPNPAPFNGGAAMGASPGFMLEQRDLGATVNDPTMKFVSPGANHHITDITFMLAPGAPLGMYNLRSTTLFPRISEVTDTDFNDNNIIPAGSVTLNIVPEPSTLALLCLAAAGAGLVAYRRRRAALQNQFASRSSNG